MFVSSSIPLLIVILSEISFLLLSISGSSSVCGFAYHYHQSTNTLGTPGCAEIQRVNNVNLSSTRKWGKRPSASSIGNGNGGAIGRGRSMIPPTRTGVGLEGRYYNSIPRGGGFSLAAMSDDDESEESEYDSDSESDSDSDSETEVEVDIITDSNGSYAASASAAKPMNDYEAVGMSEEERDKQAQSYVASAGLWSALVLDTVLNKKKRLLLFPQPVSAVVDTVAKVAEGVGETVTSAVETATSATAATTTAAATVAATTPSQITNILPTAHLTSGFLLAGGIALLLSRPPPPTLYDDGSSTSLPAAVRIRQRLHLLLSFFSLANLGAHLNSVAAAPFLGGAAAAIHGHNLMVGVSGWRKEVRAAVGRPGFAKVGDGADGEEVGRVGFGGELWRGTKRTAASLVGGGRGGRDRRQEAVRGMRPGTSVSYLLYVVASQVLFFRGCVVFLGSLVPHYVACWKLGTFTSAPVEQLKLISLEWASFARFITASIVCLTLKEEAEAGRLGTFMNRSLNGILALCALAITIPPLLLRTNDPLPVTRLLVAATVCSYNAMRRRNAM